MNLHGIHGIRQGQDTSSPAAKKAAPTVSFQTVLNDKLNAKSPASSIQISNHARSRIFKRNIPIEQRDISKLETALQKAKTKGSRETLVYYKENAYLFNVKTNTLITAVDKNSMQGNVFTNIDSTIFV